MTDLQKKAKALQSSYDSSYKTHNDIMAERNAQYQAQRKAEEEERQRQAEAQRRATVQNTINNASNNRFNNNYASSYLAERYPTKISTVNTVSTTPQTPQAITADDIRKTNSFYEGTALSSRANRKPVETTTAQTVNSNESPLINGRRYSTDRKTNLGKALDLSTQIAKDNYRDIKGYAGNEAINLVEPYMQRTYQNAQSRLSNRENLINQYNSLAQRQQYLLTQVYNESRASSDPETVKRARQARESLERDYGMTNDEIEAFSRVSFYKNSKDLQNTMDEWIVNYVNEHPFTGSTVLPLASGTLGALYGQKAKLNALQDSWVIKNATGVDAGMNPYGNIPQNISDSATDTVVGWDNSINLGPIHIKDSTVDEAYQLGMSEIQSKLAAAVSLGTGKEFTGSALLGLGADAQFTKELAERGVSAELSAIGGFASGVFEMLWEEASIEAFLEAPSVDNVSSLLKSMGINAITNGSEELNTELSNIIYDVIANGGASDFYARVQYYESSNGGSLSQAEAYKMAARDMAMRVVDAAKGGAIQGIFAGAGASGLANIRNQEKLKTYGSNIRNNATANKNTIATELLNSGVDSTKVDTYTNTIDKMLQGKKLTPAELSELYSDPIASNVANSLKNAQATAYDNLVEQGLNAEDNTPANEYARELREKRVLGYTDSELGKMYALAQGENANKVRNIYSVVDEAIDTSKAKSRQIAEAISNKINNRRLTERQTELLESQDGKIAQAAVETEQNKYTNEQRAEAVSNFKQNENLAYDNKGIKENAKVRSGITSSAIGKFTDISKGLVELSNGTTQSIGNIKFNDSNQYSLYKGAFNMASEIGLTTEDANSIVNMYSNTSGMSVKQYLASTKAAIIQGAYDIDASQFIGNLTPNQAKFFNSIGNNLSTIGTNVKTNKLVDKKAKISEVIKNRVVDPKLKGKVSFMDSELTNARIKELKLDKNVKDMVYGTRALASVLDNMQISFVYSVLENGRYYESDGKGNILLDANGKKKDMGLGWNGMTNTKNGKVVIDLNAEFSNNNVIQYTLAHELTHEIRIMSPESFNKLANWIVKEYNASGMSKSLDASISKYMRIDGMDYDTAFEEVVAQSMQTMLTDDKQTVLRKLTEFAKQGNAEAQAVDRIYQFLNKVSHKLAEYYASIKGKSLSEEGQFIESLGDRVDELREIFAEALWVANENAREGIIQDELNMSAEEYNKVKEADLDGKDITEMHQYKYADQHKKDLEKHYDENVSPATLEQINKQYNNVLKIWEKVSKKLDSKFLDDWNNQSIDKNSRVYSVFKKQMGYTYAIELSSMCKKGVPLFDAIDTLARKSVIDKFASKQLGVEERKILYSILKDKGFDIPCAICYVEQARQQEGPIISSFVNGTNILKKNGTREKYKLGWNQALDMIAKNMKASGYAYNFDMLDKSIMTINYKPTEAKMTPEQLNAFYDAWFKALNETVDGFNEDRALVKKSAEEKYKKALEEYPEKKKEAERKLAEWNRKGELGQKRGKNEPKIPKEPQMPKVLYDEKEMRKVKPLEKLKDMSPESINQFFKDNKDLSLKVFKVLYEDPTIRKKIGDSYLYNSDMTMNMAANHTELYTLFNQQGGVGGYKLKQKPIAYMGDLLGTNYGSFKTRTAGGIRNQSNSDFQMYTLIDQAQMYIDLTAKGYYLHAYTKVLSELKLFGLSGAKINASLIPKVILLNPHEELMTKEEEELTKKYAGLGIPNKKGGIDVEATRQAMRDGRIDLLQPIYDDFEGIPHAEAFMLIDDANYSKSITGICIGYSHEHIKKLLNEPRVQLIIGFHDKTDDTSKRYQGAVYAFNYNGINEAKGVEKLGLTEVDENGEVHKVEHLNFNEFLIQAEDMFTKSGESFVGTTTYGVDEKGKPKQYKANDIPFLAVALYKDFCYKNGLEPAYNIPGIVDHPNYYKLLADFGLYNSEGKYAPHRKVNFQLPSSVPMLQEDGSVKSMDTQTFIQKELEGELKMRDNIANALADESENGIIPRFVKAVNELGGNELYQRKDTEYLNAIEQYGEDSKEVADMVREAAAEAGYIRELFHGSWSDNVKVFNFGKSGIYTTNLKDVANTYGKHTYALYGKEGSKVLTIDAEGKPYYSLDSRNIGIDFAKYPLLKDKVWMTTDDITRVAFAEGYDVIVFDNIHDTFSPTNSKSLGTDVVYKESNMVKSADPVTYDEDHNIIPLSQRFNTENDDIRYQRRDTDIPVDPTHPDVDLAMSIKNTDNMLDLIANGKKTVETRENKSAFNMFKGKTVGLLDRATNKIVAYAKVSDKLKEYNTYEEFRKDFKNHKVPAKSTFDMKKGKDGKWIKKYGIVFDNVEKLDTPIEAKGRNFALGKTMYYTPTESETESKYQKKGTNKYGIEVYETSDETMSLSWNERINKYKSLLENDFYGRTARFNRNGHIYYAKFDKSSSDKVIYGEKTMSKNGKRAIIKAGADGDIFDIVENSSYKHSSLDAKNHKLKDGYTDYFDYFYKTVQIDNKVFDLIVNVKKQYGKKDGFTYTIKVLDNKKIEASPAITEKSAINSQGLPLGNNITTPSNDSQGLFQLKDTTPDIDLDVIRSLTEANKQLTKELGKAQVTNEKIIERAEELADKRKAKAKQKQDDLRKLVKLQGTVNAYSRGSLDAIAAQLIKFTDAKNVDKSKLIDKLQNYYAWLTDYGLKSEDMENALKRASTSIASTLVSREDPIANQVAIEETAEKVIELYWNAKPVTTPATKYAKQIAELKQKNKSIIANEKLASDMYYGRKIAELTNEKNAKINSLIEQKNKGIANERLAADMYYGRKLDELRKNRDKQITELKQKQKQKEADARENRDIKIVKGKIVKNLTELSKALVSPSVKHYVPVELRNTVASLLSAIDMTESDKYYKSGDREGELRESKARAMRNLKWANLQAEYKKVKEKSSSIFDPVVYEMMDNFFNTTDADGNYMGNKAVEDMSLEELTKLNTIIKAVKTTVNNAVKLQIGEKNYDAFKFARDMIEETKSVKGKQNKALDKYAQSQLRADTMFNRLGGYTPDSKWKKAAKLLDDGQLKKTSIIVEGSSAFNDLLKGKDNLKELSGFRKNQVDIGLRDANGNPVYVTRGMMLSVYMHLLNEDNIKHVASGSFTVPDLKAYYKGKGDAWGTDIVRAEGISKELSDISHRIMKAQKEGDRELAKELKTEYKSVFEEERLKLIAGENSIKGKIESQLTDYEKAWIEKAQWFFDTFSRGYLNEATMNMYGFEKANVENYFPIHSDKNFLDAKFESVAHDFSLENMGMMKDRTYASNPILLEDITDVIFNQLNQVADYAGLAPAIKDFNRIYNMKLPGYSGTIAETINSKFGRDGKNYIDKLLGDLQGANKGEKDFVSRFLDGARGHMAQAVLSLNLRVTLSQAASYPTAGAELGFKPLAKALFVGGKNNWMLSSADKELIQKYSPLLAYRLQGNSTTELGNIAETTRPGSEGWMLQKTKYLMNWIQAMDGATVGRLWYASQYYVDDNYNLEKGTDEYYKKVAEVFNDTVEKTQPNYSVMQRPEILRSSNSYTKALTMFMTQRLQNFNIIYDSVAQYVKQRTDLNNKANNVTSADVKKSKDAVVRAVTSQVAANLTLVAMKVVVDLLMHNVKPYKDDDDEVTEESILKKLAEYFLESEASSILFGSELYEFIASKVKGDRYYGLDVQGISSISDILEDMQKISLKDGLQFEKDIKPLAEDVTMFFGIPTQNAEKIAKMFTGWYDDITNGGTFGDNETIFSSQTTAKKHYLKTYINALMDGDIDKATDYYTRAEEIELTDKNGRVTKMETTMKAVIKSMYQDGDLTYDEALRLLMKYMTREKAIERIESWNE